MMFYSIEIEPHHYEHVHEINWNGNARINNLNTGWDDCSSKHVHTSSSDAVVFDSAVVVHWQGEVQGVCLTLPHDEGGVLGTLRQQLLRFCSLVRSEIPPEMERIPVAMRIQDSQYVIVNLKFDKCEPAGDHDSTGLTSLN